jgi:penicillin-binding protein 2
MNSIHHIIRSASVLFLSVAIISQAAIGATKHPAKERKQGRVEKRQPSGRRAERIRLAARGRAEAARRRAEAARLAAIARQLAAEEAMRDRVQSMIEKDDATGEDAEIRRVAVNALGHHAGTVVVMDPKTGRIYTVVNQQWALREGFKPCSTIKLVTGLAGLNEKIIDPANTAAISYTNKVDLTSALAHSKNDYFQQVGGQVGFNKMISYARQLGLGEKTGINVRNESQGRVPTLKSGFAVNHMSSHGDDFKVTALQLATLVSAMANGGKLLTPFVPHTSQEEERLSPKVRRLVNIDSESFRHMVPGMIGSVSYGSGRKAFDPQGTVAGKTGTCTEHGTWVGLFTSYAPLNNPRFAVVVIAQGADGRNHFPAAVAGRIYRDLNGRFGAGKLEIATMRDSKPQTDRSKASLTEQEKESADDEESDDSDNDTATSAAAPEIAQPRPLWGNTRTPVDSKVKRVLMSIPNRASGATKPTTVSKDASKANSQTMERARRVTDRQQ